MRINKHVLCGALFALLFGVTSAKPPVVPAHRSFSEGVSLSKPNVILIVADDHGYADFSHLGIHDFIRTPNLDRLAAEGMWFSDAYATSPICNPSRCGLLTGQYQQRQGDSGNGQAAFGHSHDKDHQADPDPFRSGEIAHL